MEEKGWTLEYKKRRYPVGASGKAELLLSGALDKRGNCVLPAVLLLAVSAAVHFAGIELFQPAFADLPSVPQAPDSVSSTTHQHAPPANSYYRSMSESLSVIASHGSGSTNLPSSYHRSMLEAMSLTTLQSKAPNSYSRSMSEQASFTTGLPPSASNPPSVQPQRTLLMPNGASTNQKIDERLTAISKFLGKRADTTARNISGGIPYLMTESISSMNSGPPDGYSELLEISDQNGNPEDSSTLLRQLAAYDEYISMQSIQNATLVNTSVSSVFLLGAITIVVVRHPAVSGGRMRRKMLALFLIKHVAHDGTVLYKNEIAPLNRVLLGMLVAFIIYSLAGAIDPSSGQAFAANLAVNKVQSGTLTLGTNPTDVTITSIDMSKAFAMCFSRTDSSNADRAETCNLTNSTNLRVQAGAASTGINVAWYVVEFKEGAFVQRGETAWTTDTAGENITISTVDLSKTFVLITTRTTSTSQIIDEQRATRAALTSSTNLELTRSGPGFPQVSSITASTFGTDSTTHNVAMPATVASGDLLLVLFTSDGTATVTTPGGWDFINTATRSTVARGSIYAKIATGSEGGTTVNFATSASEQAAAQVYRIPAGSWYGDITQGIDSAVVDPGGTTSSPNPPSLSPFWGSAQDLWIAYWGSSSSASVNSYPTSYASGLHTLAGSGTSGAAVSSASRQVEATSENPSAFSLPSAVSGVVYTIAIRPTPFNMAVTHVWQVIELQDTVVQSGTTTLSGVSSTTASISPVDLAETFLVFSTEGATATDGVEAQYYVRGRFTSTTQITFDRNSATNSATISWFAVSVDRSTVQSGTNAAAATETIFNNTINAVTLSRTSPFVSAKVGSTGNADQDSGFWVPTFTTTTNLRVQRTSTQSVPSDISWFAVEWPSAARSMNDNLAVSDVISKASSYLLTVQLGASDAVARTATLSRSASEQLGVTDTITKAVSKPLTEQLGVADSIQRTTASFRTMSEQLGMSETVAGNTLRSGSITEQFASIDAIATSVSKSTSEQLGVSEDILRTTILTRTLSEQLTLTETITKAVSLALLEQLVLTEVADRSTVQSISISDQLAVSDSISMAHSTALSESVNITDTIVVFVNFARAVSDALQIGDAVSTSSSITIVITDTMAINEDFANIAVLFNLNVGESLVLAQGFATNFTAFFDQVEGEGIIIQDDVTLSLGAIASSQELLALQDQITGQITMLQTKDVHSGGSSSEFTKTLTESLLVTSAVNTIAVNTSVPIGSEGKIIIKDIVDSLTLRAEQPQPLYQRVITIHDITVAVSIADIKSAATFGTAVAALNFEIMNKGNTAEELMLRVWYSTPAGDTMLYEAEKTITVNAGESILEEVKIPFSSPDLHHVMIEVESDDGTLSSTAIAVNVPWLTVYLYILIVIATAVVVTSIAYVIHAMRRSTSFIIGDK